MSNNFSDTNFSFQGRYHDASGRVADPSEIARLDFQFIAPCPQVLQRATDTCYPSELSTLNGASNGAEVSFQLEPDWRLSSSQTHDHFPEASEVSPEVGWHVPYVTSDMVSQNMQISSNIPLNYATYGAPMHAPCYEDYRGCPPTNAQGDRQLVLDFTLPSRGGYGQSSVGESEPRPAGEFQDALNRETELHASPSVFHFQTHSGTDELFVFGSSLDGAVSSETYGQRSPGVFDIYPSAPQLPQRPRSPRSPQYYLDMAARLTGSYSGGAASTSPGDEPFGVSSSDVTQSNKRKRGVDVPLNPGVDPMALFGQQPRPHPIDRESATWPTQLSPPQVSFPGYNADNLAEYHDGLGLPLPSATASLRFEQIVEHLDRPIRGMPQASGKKRHILPAVGRSSLDAAPSTGTAASGPIPEPTYLPLIPDLEMAQTPSESTAPVIINNDSQTTLPEGQITYYDPRHPDSVPIPSGTTLLLFRKRVRSVDDASPKGTKRNRRARDAFKPYQCIYIDPVFGKRCKAEFDTRAYWQRHLGTVHVRKEYRAIVSKTLKISNAVALKDPRAKIRQSRCGLCMWESEVGNRADMVWQRHFKEEHGIPPKTKEDGKPPHKKSRQGRPKALFTYSLKP